YLSISTPPSTTPTHSLSLHDALPIFALLASIRQPIPTTAMEEISEPTTESKKPLLLGLVLLVIFAGAYIFVLNAYKNEGANRARSEEHTSELQSRGHLVCRLLLEKKK